MRSVHGSFPHHPKGTPPDSDDQPRTCREDDCHTKLSRYNTGTHCWQHSPLKYPRARGDTRNR